MVGKPKMVTAMLELFSPGLFCIGYFTAGLGTREADDLGPGLKQSVIPPFMNATAKNSTHEHHLFIGVKNCFKGLGVTLWMPMDYIGRCTYKWS